MAIKSLYAKLGEIKRDVVALTFAIRDPKCPRAAKVVATIVIAYALSPIDLIPDFIPVIGIVDDIILVPLGILLVERMIPPEIMSNAREKAMDERVAKWSTLGLILVLTTWLLIVVFGYWFLRQYVHHRKAA